MSSNLNRRDFLKRIALGSIGVSAIGQIPIFCSNSENIPSYLKDYSEVYRSDPHAAALQWFKDAKFGLFMHYGPSSLLGRGEWVQYTENIPLNEYIKLKNEFYATNFNADFITDLALEAGMKYVNITSRHHDSFCLFGSKVSDYSSVNSPAKRDLVGELSEQCSKKGLGLFLYYSYALDWHHPYFYPRSMNPIARPKYDNPDEVYKWRKKEDFQYYLEFVHTQIKELLTNYGPVAGMWFDPIMGYYGQPDLFPIDETYAMVRKLQPQTLISFKQGANGDEDFAAPERSGHSLSDNVRARFGEKKAEIAAAAWEKNKNKYIEICDTMQPGAWGYRRADDSRHHKPDKVVKMLVGAVCKNANLLLNTGPLPDGSIHHEDVNTFRKVGKWLNINGTSIYRTAGGPFLAGPFSGSTYRDKTVYLHFPGFNGGHIKLPISKEDMSGIKTFIGDITEVNAENKNTKISVPNLSEASPDYIIELQLKSQVKDLKLENNKIEFEFEKKYKSIKLHNDPSPKYPGRGLHTLQDGIPGGLDFNSGDWLGFEQENFDAVVELENKKTIDNIEVGFLQNQDSWIFLPEEIRFYLSNDGKLWSMVYTEQSVLKRAADTVLKNISKTNIGKAAKFIKITAKNVGICPDWHKGAGGKAWLFVDEIIIE